MKESDFEKMRIKGEEKAEPYVSYFRKVLVEMYLQGYVDGVNATEDERDAARRLKEEAEALDKDPEPVVNLKPGAIFMKRLKKEEFSVRTWNALRGHDIETLGDLMKYTRSELLSFRGFGTTCLAEVMDYVEKYGQTLKMR